MVKLLQHKSRKRSIIGIDFVHDSTVNYVAAFAAVNCYHADNRVFLVSPATLSGSLGAVINSQGQ